MRVLLAESIPSPTSAWAILWLLALSLGLLGLLMLTWMISRHRLHRYLNDRTDGGRQTCATPDPWSESARRLKSDGGSPPMEGPDES